MRQFILVFALGLAAAVLSLRIPSAVLPVDVDGSWQQLLQLDWNQRARSGVETLFTYGPAGFLFGTSIVCFEQGALARHAAALFAALATGFALASLLPRLPTGGWRAGYAVCLLAFVPLSLSSEAFLTNAVLGLILLLRLGVDDQPRSRWAGAGDVALVLATAVVFALAAATKFTYTVHGGALVAILVGVLLVRRRFVPASLVGLTFAGAFLGVWVALGQRLGDLPAYMRGSAEIAKGYLGAQGVRGPTQDLVAAEIAVVLVLLVCAWACWTARSLARVGGVAMALGTLFFAWKGGFVRHDIGHAGIFFGVASLVPFLVLAAVGRAPGTVFRAFAVLAVAISLGENVYVRERLDAGYGSAVNATAHSLTLLDRQSFAEYVRLRLEAAPEAPTLPQTRALVGDEPVDMMGCQQGMLFANHFAIRHRPVFQSYSVFTPYLQDLNAAFFAAPDAPRYVLAQVLAIDGHFPLAEDSAAWRVLLDRYQPEHAEAGLLLLARRPESPPLQQGTVVLERRAAMGEWIELAPAAEWHELALDIAYTTRGKLAAFAFRPGEIYLEVRRGQQQSTFEIAPLMVQSEFLLDPVVQNESDLLAAYLGEPLPRVAAFRVLPAPGVETKHFEPTYGLRVLRRQPPVLDAEVAVRARAHLTALTFPSFSFLPTRVEPARGVSTHGLGEQAWVLAHAPSALHFTWPGGAHALVADFQILAEAYAGDRETDGSVFTVEIGENAPRRVVFERLLDPRRRPQDRGPQRLQVQLDLPAGETVVLAVGVGAHGNAVFDWTCWRGVRLVK